jgi:hypothetical protein
MEFRNAYIHLKGNRELAVDFRFRLGLTFLPIVSPFAEIIDADEYGSLVCFDIDAERLTATERQRLIDWVWQDGDNSDRDSVVAEVDSNKVCYVLRRDDESEVLQHDPDAWG